jgi:hypothetical protein
MKITVTSFIFSLCFVSLAQFAEAETIECGTGDVQCLIAAIHQANADPRKTTIRLAGGTYLLTSIDNYISLYDNANGLPLILSPVTIDGGDTGTTLARAPDAPWFRFFYVRGTGHLTLDGLTLTEGGGRSPFFLGNRGGAILNDRGTVTIVDTTIARGRAGIGGGLFNGGGAVTLTRTVFDGNLGADAGGLYTEQGEVRISQSKFIENSGGQFITGGVWAASGTIVIDQTTFAGNDGDGAGAIYVGGQATVSVHNSAFLENGSPVTGTSAISNSGTLYVTNSTFARNVGNSLCRGVVSNGGTMSIVNSTFAENRGNGYLCLSTPAIHSYSGATTLLQNTILVHDPFDVQVQDCVGIVTSLGNNLIGDPTGCTITLKLSDLTGEANLGAFTDDGTPGNAHYPLLPESQAIDAAKNAACPKKDQIGQARQPRCDIGAVEFTSSDNDDSSSLGAGSLRVQ